jgi:hypothetical protein
MPTGGSINTTHYNKKQIHLWRTKKRPNAEAVINCIYHALFSSALKMKNPQNQSLEGYH